MECVREGSLGALLNNFSCTIAINEQINKIMIDSNIKVQGEFIDYFLLPENKNIQFVCFKSETEFRELLAKYDAKKINVDYKKISASNDSNYPFLARISLATVYALSNGLFGIDQVINDQPNPYYICESLEDFKLITKYLIVYRTETNWPLEVEASIHEHFEIKKFLIKKAEILKLLPHVSDKSHKFYKAETGQYIEISYADNSKANKEEEVTKIIWGKIYKPIYGNKFDNEEVIYWSLVIYESLDKLRLHNVFINKKYNK